MVWFTGARFESIEELWHTSSLSEWKRLVHAASL